MEINRIPLSFRKFSQLLEKYGYGIGNIYKLGEDCRFIEVKTPKYHKVFYISIPHRYQITTSDGTDICSSSSNEPQENYISMFRQDLLSDMLCISGDAICYFTDDEFQFYGYGEHEKFENYDHPKEELIESLEKDYKQVKQSHKINRTVEFIVHRPPKDNAVELVFEDDEGNPIEAGTDMEKIIIDAQTPTKINIGKDRVSELILPQQLSPSPSISDMSEMSDLENAEGLNYMPNLQQKEIAVGLMYVCIDINEFFHNAATYEQRILEYYNVMEKKESELRKEKMQKIQNMIEEFKTESFEKLQEIVQTENNIRAQISRLSSVLVSCENLEAKNKGKEIQDIEGVKTKTRSALDELNKELLTQRDTAHKLLSKCERQIQYLMEE